MSADRGPIGDLRAPIAISVSIQLPLAVFLAHAYDMPLFMASGYLAAHGENPYIPADLSAVFGSKYFRLPVSYGYPPPWILVCAIAYRLSFALAPSLYLYDLFIKLPIVAANVALAILVRRIAGELGAGERRSRAAASAILYNPLLLLTTAAWGQIDAVAILCALMALLLLSRGREGASAAVLALALSIKPIVLPLLPLVLLAIAGPSPARALKYAAVLLGSACFFCVLPFFVFGWDPGIILRGWNAQFASAGGLSLFSFYELLGKGYALPPGMDFVGFLWVPALGLSLFLMRRPTLDLGSLLRSALGLMLVFFLCRAWLSEPNVDVLVPLAAVLAALGAVEKGR